MGKQSSGFRNDLGVMELHFFSNECYQSFSVMSSVSSSSGGKMIHFRLFWIIPEIKSIP